ncbi:MAG: hypothetical protein KF863_10390 [Rubrivivax sp.]|nr:hypothetical protein [Rubrivivax sp.]
MGIDHDKLRRLESALETADALHEGLRRAYFGHADGGGGYVPGLRDDAQAARVDLLGRLTRSKSARRHVGGPTFDFAPHATAAEMLAALEAEHVRQHAASAAPDTLAILRSDIAAARAAQELHDRAEAMRRSMEARQAEVQPLRQLVAACREFTGHARSTLAHFAR